MQAQSNSNSSPLQEEYEHYTLATNLRNSKVACVLVVIFMPVGMILDYFVYPDYVAYFLKLRLFCSALTAFVLVRLLQKGLSPWEYRILCTAWYVLPAFFISWMIGKTEGAVSPYYAGLNLVIILASAVIQATLLETLIVVSLIIAMYVGACIIHRDFSDFGIIFNNCYFIALTSIIVTTGNYFFNRLRFREFQLRHELEENRQKLEESNQKLVEMDQMKSRFFANISHELRTPLTLLLAPLESLLRDKVSHFDPQARDWLHTMHVNGMRLLKLINDLLDLVRLEAKQTQVKIERVNVVNVLRGLSQSVRKLVQDKRLQLVTDVAPEVGMINTDRDKLEKIVLNLLFNAIKFTGAGGAITVKAIKDGAMLFLTVADTGMGISEKNLPHIFDRFWQADSSSRRKHQGTGIGLALVKEIVEDQGGSVAAQSIEGQGTTITVRLPYHEAPSETATSDDSESLTPAAAKEISPERTVATADDVTSDEWLVNLYRRAELFPALKQPEQTSALSFDAPSTDQRASVLVADDEPDMLRFLKSQLERYFKIYEAVDGQQAIDVASQYLPDVILCDMMMPEKDGLQVCRELRERTPTQSIPIVLLTARADEETKLNALSVGANDFLTKPFSGTELHVRLQNLVNAYQLQRKLARQKQILEATLDQLKEAELHLVQSEKLASLGRLSAGIIHEINNPLNYVKTALFVLRQKGRNFADKERAEFDDIIKDVEDGVNRVRNIVTDLRTFTHPNIGQLENVDLDKTLTLALRFVSGDKGNVQIDNQVAAHQTVWGNQNRIVQVLVNVLQNAIDALKNKTGPEPPLVTIQSRVENGTVLVIVRDNGEGIAAKHMNKIFDPFFSTKQVGEGMGLGLSICYRIMEEHRGRILVRSEPGQYSEFTLEFPPKMQQSLP
jgi:signal transduction histidine kinase